MSDTDSEQNDSGDNETEQLALQLQQMHQDALHARQESSAANAKLEALSRVFGGEKEKEVDPEEWSNDILRDLMEAEKQGQKLPVSSKMFKQLYNLSKENTASTRMLAELNKKVEMLSNPVTRVDQNSYAIVDDNINEYLEQIYGESQPMIANAVREKMVDTIRLIQKEAPNKWEQIRRSPGQLQRLVQHTVLETLPPSVIEQMKAEEEANTPLTYAQIKQAYQEMETPSFQALPAKDRQQIQTQVRHAEFEMREQARRKR